MELFLELNNKFKTFLQLYMLYFIHEKEFIFITSYYMYISFLLANTNKFAQEILEKLVHIFQYVFVHEMYMRGIIQRLLDLKRMFNNEIQAKMVQYIGYSHAVFSQNTDSSRCVHFSVSFIMHNTLIFTSVHFYHIITVLAVMMGIFPSIHYWISQDYFDK